MPIETYKQFKRQTRWQRYFDRHEIRELDSFVSTHMQNAVWDDVFRTFHTLLDWLALREEAFFGAFYDACIGTDQYAGGQATWQEQMKRDYRKNKAKKIAFAKCLRVVLVRLQAANEGDFNLSALQLKRLIVQLKQVLKLAEADVKVPMASTKAIKQIDEYTGATIWKGTRVTDASTVLLVCIGKSLDDWLGRRITKKHWNTIAELFLQWKLLPKLVRHEQKEDIAERLRQRYKSHRSTELITIPELSRNILKVVIVRKKGQATKRVRALP